VASIQYRLQKDKPTLSWGAAYADFVAKSDDDALVPYRQRFGPTWPAAVAAAAEDVAHAVEWLQNNAGRRRFDPTRIGLVGMSAGAITSTSLAYLGDAIAAPSLRIAAVVCIRGALLRGAPPRAAAPLLIAHGGEDDVIPIGRARELFALVRAENAPVEF